MQNIVINMCEKFHDDRSRNDVHRALGNRKSDSNKNPTNNNNKNVRGRWEPFPGPQNYINNERGSVHSVK